MRLNKFPSLFQVDQKLKSVIAKVTRDVYTAAYVPQVAARILSNSEKRSTAHGDGNSGRKQLKEYLADIENNKAPGMGRLKARFDSNEHALSEGENDLELLFLSSCLLSRRRDASTGGRHQAMRMVSLHSILLYFNDTQEIPHSYHIYQRQMWYILLNILYFIRTILTIHTCNYHLYVKNYLIVCLPPSNENG